MAVAGRLKNTVTLITGGFGKSGFAAAEKFLNAGSRVVILDIPENPSSDVKPSLKRLTKDCIAIPADVTKENEIRNAIGITLEEFGRLDNVINCVHHFLPQKKIYHVRNDKPLEYSIVNESMKVNIGGIFNVIRLTVEHLAKNEPNANGQRGVILNRSWIDAFETGESAVNKALYSGALVSMTLPLARDLSSLGIRVNCIAQGWIGDEEIKKEIKLKLLNYLESLIPFPNRLLKYSEFADLCVSVVENPLLNGEVIRLDGAVRGSF